MRRQLGDVRRSSPYDLHLTRQTELGHGFREETAAPFHRLEQGHPQVGAGERERNSGKAGAAADVDDLEGGLVRAGGGGTGGDGLGQDRAVEKVALPEPAGLPRTDQPSLDSCRRKHLDIPHRETETITEDGPSGVGNHLGGAGRAFGCRRRRSRGIRRRGQRIAGGGVGAEATRRPFGRCHRFTSTTGTPGRPS
ncbi:hypothetical protein BBK14_05235 [Parafrankia soli]|uniref:Uncharacterized protein n=1 Tax=Parafrankia soli TaxID=2599596 RepID=A0A1S1Q132_9ACTN|nr:hypothetical protein BBK14_05235 [Parafrankia soli]